MKFLEKYGIYLKDQNQLLTALTHTSYSNEHGCENYERLEFLGDAVLELITSEYFYEKKDFREGDMTKIRSRYVCEHANYEYAKKVGFIPYIRVGKGQINNVNETIIADVFEAILGAVFLEYGYEVSKKYILEVITPFIEENRIFYSDYKSLLQEMIQTTRKSLEYREIDETGPAHDKTYTFEVVIDGIIYGRGKGKSKKEAEQMAAKDAYMKACKK
ncbi:MAG: ribonuclease III [Bacilli bacterium]|nr:ribonuclease III [Bacilli bacterium]